MEVQTSNVFTHNGKYYETNITDDTPNTISCFTINSKKERKRINSKLYNINTNDYNNLTANKMVQIVNYYDKFERYVLNVNKKIIRNFMKKSIVFKLDKRIIEVLLKEKELTIVFLDIVKDYDPEKRLFVRKGYEKHSLSYAINVDDEKSFNYAIMLFNKEYELLTDPFINNKVDDIQKELINRIRRISNFIVKNKINKGIMFRSSRNFAILEKRKYGIHVRISNVDDNNGILKNVGRSNYEPLCKYFNVIDYSDIEMIMPYIQKSFELTKYNVNDVKSGIYKMYANK